YNYILGVKPGDHKYLFDWVDALDENDVKTHSFYKMAGQKVKKRITYEFKWRNKVPLNDSNSDLLVNFLDFKEITETLDIAGEVIKTKTSPWTWVTDIKITQDNVYQIMRGGRARWRIENEVFNTLKNQGYNLEHNFGHGFKNLCNNFIMLMMLAFLVDQLQEIACSTFKKAFTAAERKKYLWEKVRNRFTTFLIDTWKTLFDSIINPPEISLNSG
ncbi:MAG: transposase, partial [Bacteriovoracaceae bacterium]|nr:transposase [Bacteriovoracaceae bacterium]